MAKSAIWTLLIRFLPEPWRSRLAHLKRSLEPGGVVLARQPHRERRPVHRVDRSPGPFGLQSPGIASRCKARLLPRKLKDPSGRHGIKFGPLHVAGDDDEERRRSPVRDLERTRRREHSADALDQQRMPAFCDANEALGPEQPLAERAGEIVEPVSEIGKLHVSRRLRRTERDARMRG
jgi:hypothetical protein